ncbi:hypothetical protein B0H17DRAFT_1278964 [Mycena rosella]|uniref:Uncharacterized protein n=1 Tax=Mycena rosella TaxID=1033263 RepID=A0AAD7FQE4_MYCRO|nr:hypothetical protein B0H17DRAFT_1278964 [Mycena rosella]
MWYSSIIRIISAISVSSALAWVASAAPVPEANGAALGARSALDQFAELDIAAREPEETLDTIDARMFSARDPPDRSPDLDHGTDSVWWLSNSGLPFCLKFSLQHPSHSVRLGPDDRPAWLGLSSYVNVAVGSVHDSAPLPIRVMSPLTGFGAVIAACFTSGLAGVYFEMVLKNPRADLWVRIVQRSLFSIIPALFPVLYSSAAPPYGFVSLTLLRLLLHTIFGYGYVHELHVYVTARCRCMGAIQHWSRFEHV